MSCLWCRILTWLNKLRSLLTTSPMKNRKHNLLYCWLAEGLHLKREMEGGWCFLEAGEGGRHWCGFLLLGFIASESARIHAKAVVLFLFGCVRVSCIQIVPLSHDQSSIYLLQYYSKLFNFTFHLALWCAPWSKWPVFNLFFHLFSVISFEIWGPTSEYQSTWLEPTKRQLHYRLLLRWRTQHLFFF